MVSSNHLPLSSTTTDAKSSDELLQGMLSRSGIDREAGINLKGFSDEKLRDLEERAKLGDVEGVSILAKIPQNQAMHIVRRYHVGSSGSNLRRKMLRTPDAKRLAKGALAIFADEASSVVAKDRIALLMHMPVQNREELRQRLEFWITGAKILEELLEETSRLDQLRNTLHNITSSQGSSEAKSSSVKKSVIETTSGILIYFVWRRQMVAAARPIMSESLRKNR